ncbi:MULTISPECIES: hypothetical protein [Leuconostoc]|uniref:LysM domain-containing protein n=2 Tax=Leuconostoc kimchii TaxID=136609 RepID=D5T4F5_LEUKI|nr:MULTISPECIES: hypothetical protein [Leuconostoc]ADG41426.1 hypothetical protein LKI_09435 [Leuconostoc kimchii IMSNU 11154]AEJ30594.1 hypothetical protein LGMK_02680 [Leuconostoc sp. C2]QBR47710.1 peptidoglycan-binding protein LysM [Leuconostoc kimchii]
MNDYDPNNMSRSSRQKKQKLEPKFARKSDNNTTGHRGLRIFLSILALVILSSVPIYGFWANQKEPEQQAAKPVSSKKASTSDEKSVSSETSNTSSDDVSTSSETEPESQSSETPSSEISSSVSSSETTSSQSSSSATQTAVLGASQTLYNFAVTHGMTTEQVVALNPGLTVDNYTQYAGRDLNTQ